MACPIVTALIELRHAVGWPNKRAAMTGRASSWCECRCWDRHQAPASVICHRRREHKPVASPDMPPIAYVCRLYARRRTDPTSGRELATAASAVAPLARRTLGIRGGDSRSPTRSVPYAVGMLLNMFRIATVGSPSNTSA